MSTEILSIDDNADIRNMYELIQDANIKLDWQLTLIRSFRNRQKT